MTIGRNDPCSCGSGKKYKKCCLQKEVASQPRVVVDFAYESFLNMRRKATDKMVRILTESADDEVMDEFEEDYWNSAFLDDEEVEALLKSAEATEAMERQIPQALMNCLVLEEKYPAPYLLERHRGRFSGAEIRFLEDFEQARVTYVQVREFFPEEGYTVVEDIFDGASFNLYDKNLSTSLHLHDIISARLVPFPDKNGFVMEPLATCRITPDKKPMLLDLLGREAIEFFRDKSDREKPATPGEIHQLLKDDPIIFYWMDMRVWHDVALAPPPKMVTTDGEEIVFITARFSSQDPAALKAALLKQRNFRHQGEKKGEDHFSWLNAKDFVMGTLRLNPKTAEVNLETNSRERFKKWERKLRSLGEVVFLDKKEESMEAARGRMPEASAASPALSPEEMRQLAPEIEKHLADRWLKEEIPMLGGKTPVEAARTPEGRKQLKELFDYIENRSAGMKGGGGQGFDVDEMKQRLGLGAF